MTILLLAAMPETELRRWESELRAVFPEENLRTYPNVGDRTAIDVALVASPPTGVLGELPNLRLIISLWRGVDKLVVDPTLPRHVPLVRLVDESMSLSMTESVLLHVLTLHRRVPEYRAQQTRAIWRGLAQPVPAERRIGILGLGDLGQAAARALVGVGFTVSGWSRGPRTVPGVSTHFGTDGLSTLLASTDILVNLLPLTRETRGLLDAAALKQLPPGASLINMARGEHVVEADLLAALESGQIAHAILDVFATEPLPAAHPFWRHPKVTVMPHVAANSDPAKGARIVADNVARFRSGQSLDHVVSWQAGY